MLPAPASPPRAATRPNLRTSSKFAALLLALASPMLRAADKWTTPTPAELAMTSIPQLPGAPAVILYREVVEDDQAFTTDYYFRIKILNDGGRDYANVELPATLQLYDTPYENIAGRTIQPDGTIVLFTGKPFERLVVKSNRLQFKSLVFTMRAVQVGSIIEYRYRKSSGFLYDPIWLIQSDLYILKEHFFLQPTERRLVDNDVGGQATVGVAWTPILPSGAKVVTSRKSGFDVITLDMENVSPLPAENDTPPVGSVGFRVLLYYTAYKDQGAFWAGAGKLWAKARNNFTGPGTFVKQLTKNLISPADSDEIKLKKIYAAVTALDNIDYKRAREARENKAAGLKPPENTDDVLRQKRGTSAQLTELFVAMARAAGCKAWLMGVANRAQRIFIAADMTLRQIDDLIAIVVIDGKDVYVDPGSPFSPFGFLPWQHALAGGLRQTETGTQLATTPSEPLAANHVTRVADLKLDPDGRSTGTVVLTYTGDPAVALRQNAAQGDDASIHTDLRTQLEAGLPTGMEVTVGAIDNLTDRDQPLRIHYTVTGPIGMPTGKRLLVPADIFVANVKPAFTATRRELPVDLHYGSTTQDAVRYTLAGGMMIESAPKASSERYQDFATLSTSTLETPGSSTVTYRRNFNLGRYIYNPSEYAGLHTFYAASAAMAQEVFVVTRQPNPPGKP